MCRYADDTLHNCGSSIHMESLWMVALETVQCTTCATVQVPSWYDKTSTVFCTVLSTYIFVSSFNLYTPPCNMSGFKISLSVIPRYYLGNYFNTLSHGLWSAFLPATVMHLSEDDCAEFLNLWSWQPSPGAWWPTEADVLGGPPELAREPLAMFIDHHIHHTPLVFRLKEEAHAPHFCRIRM